MKLILGAGVAGLLMIAGGAPVAALSQSASPEGPDMAATTVQSSTTSTEDDATDAADLDATEPEQTEAEESATETDEDSTLDEGLGGTLGQAHAAAMKVWTQCVSDAASGPKAEGQPIPPKLACGTKPLGPGQILQQQGVTTDTDEADTDEAEPETDADDSTTSGGASDHAGSHGRAHAGASHAHSAS